MARETSTGPALIRLLLAVASGSILEDDRLGLEEREESLGTALPAQARLLEPAEGDFLATTEEGRDDLGGGVIKDRDAIRTASSSPCAIPCR
jgi:hypothetical protein